MPHPSRISRALDWSRGALTGAARQARSILPGQFQGFLLGAPTLSGVTVTPQTALGLTAFFAGVNVISSDVAKLPLGLYRRQRNGGQVLVTNDPRQSICRSRWNPESNAMRGRQHSMGRVLGWGNDYSLILRDPDGMPTGLQPFNPATMLPMRDDASKSLYYLDVESNQKYRPENILHVAGLGFDGIMGYCPVTLHRQAIGLGMAAEQFGASLFGNGAIPKGMLKTPKKLSEQAARRLRDTFYATHGGPQNANRTAVLEDGLEWVGTQINPDDAQFLATRQFQVVEVCRMLNLPPHKLQDYTQSHRSSTEEGNLDYLTGNLQGWLEAIEAELDSKLLFPAERDRYFFAHDMSALLRGNMSARSAFYKTLFTVGSITPNEIRTKENLNPSKEPNADKAYLQAQFVPLDAAGEAMAAKAAGGPDPGAADDKPDPEDPNGNEPGAGRSRPRRMNPNHGADGKFSSGSGGGIGGHGDVGAMSSAEQYALAEKIVSGLLDHDDPVGQLTGQFPPHDDGWEADAKDQYKGLVKDQAKEVKDQQREQASDLKDHDRDAAKEAKAFDRDQAKEAREFEADQADAAKEHAKDQASDLKDHDKEQAQERKAFDKDEQREQADYHKESDPSDSPEEFAANQKSDRDEFEAQQADDRKSFLGDQKAADEAFHEQQASDKQDFHAQQASDLDDFRDEQKEGRKGFLEDQATDREALTDEHRATRDEMLTSFAVDLMDQQQYHDGEGE